MNDSALIFGAGKTGRGFAAHLAFLGGYNIVLVDKDRKLVADLQKENQYNIQILGNEERNCTIQLSGVYHIEDVSWHDELVKAAVVFTAVFGNNLESLAGYLAIALQKRYAVNPKQALTIITCENLTNAAGLLKDCVLKKSGQEKEGWLSTSIGFSEAIIFCTCLDASPDQPPLTVRAQNFFELPCDGDAIKQTLHVYGLKPLKNFTNQLKRKIYTYNCINAVITYLGAQKGYTQLHEAGNDKAILAVAQKAAAETSLALVAEFGFDPEEQKEWTNAAFAKFKDKNIPDPIERNGADPERKLGRDDRLIGPALLALKHGIYPEGLLAGIIACLDYKDTGSGFRLAHLITEKGLDYVLKQVCGLSGDEALFTLIKTRISEKYSNGS